MRRNGQVLLKSLLRHTCSLPIGRSHKAEAEGRGHHKGEDMGGGIVEVRARRLEVVQRPAGVVTLGAALGRLWKGIPRVCESVQGTTAGLG